MSKYSWSSLTPLQIGKYAEYFVKMEFTLHGFDVYTAEVDDKGIDFVVRSANNLYFDIQVKSIRSSNYVFLPKHKFELRSNLYASLVIFSENTAPEIFLIPSFVWQAPNALFVDRDYEGKKSKPEWGIQLSLKNLALLKMYKLDDVIETLRHRANEQQSS